jgi:hypothetical protein
MAIGRHDRLAHPPNWVGKFAADSALEEAGSPAYVEPLRWKGGSAAPRQRRTVRSPVKALWGQLGRGAVIDERATRIYAPGRTGSDR